MRNRRSCLEYHPITAPFLRCLSMLVSGAVDHHQLRRSGLALFDSGPCLATGRKALAWLEPKCLNPCGFASCNRYILDVPASGSPVSSVGSAGYADWVELGSGSHRLSFSRRGNVHSPTSAGNARCSRTGSFSTSATDRAARGRRRRVVYWRLRQHALLPQQCSIPVHLAFHPCQKLAVSGESSTDRLDAEEASG